MNSLDRAIRILGKDIKICDDIAFYQFSFSSGRSEGLTINENEIRKHAEALLKKYGEKMVTVSRKGKPIMKFINQEKR